MRYFVAGAIVAFGFSAQQVNAQCETWEGKPDKEGLVSAHSVYRTYLKDKEQEDIDAYDDETFNIAFSNWEKVYTAAPAADGNRATHFEDGRILYLSKINRTEDQAEKDAFGAKAVELYDQQAKCYPEDLGYLMGWKGYEMFYEFGFGYDKQVYDVLIDAFEKSGNETQFYFFDPLADLLVYLYKDGQITKEEAIATHDKMQAILDHNIANNAEEKADFVETKERVEAYMAEVASELFDCAYFKKTLLPVYQSKQGDTDALVEVYERLIKEGCEPTDPELATIKGEYDTYIAEVRAAKEAEKRANNPLYDAAQLQKEGKNTEAIARYKEAIEASDNDDAKAQAYNSIAFIQLWKLNQPSAAASSARKAASLKSGWGQPYITIGDAYAKGSRSCGDAWNQRLAVLAAVEKYRYARSIDPEVSDTAAKRISNYANSKPEKSEIFMRKLKVGDKVKVGCWIGETVTLVSGN